MDSTRGGRKGERVAFGCHCLKYSFFPSTHPFSFLSLDSFFADPLCGCCVKAEGSNVLSLKL